MPDLVQRSFTSGELAPSLRSRVDVSKYSTGLALCENMFVRAQGGAYSRPGTYFIGEVGTSSKRARLVPFSFNTQQTYILVFEDLKIRFIKNGGYILSGGVPYEVVTTYTEAELPRLYFTQNADTLTICHPSHDPTNLGRVTDTNWTLTAISYASTVTVPTISGIVAVGAGAGANNKTYSYVATRVDVNGVESLPTAVSSLTTPSLSTTAGIKLTFSAAPGAGEYYRIYKDPSNGSGVYGWIGDTKATTYEDYNLAPITSDAPPSDRTPFASAGNKPSTVTYYQQRQVYANTTNEPQTVFTTQTGNYKSMRTSIPSRADDAVTFTIAAQQVNEIRHLLPIGNLILMTSGGEWKVTEGADGILTPSSMGVKLQSSNGSSWVPPVIINSTALYVQEKGGRVRDLGYEFAADKFTGNDVSILSEHLFTGYSISEMSYAAEPYGILWCVRNDGVLLGLTYQKEQQVVGWHKHTFSGTVESVATVGEGGRDATYIIVRRLINGSYKRYIERFESRNVSLADDAFCVDCGLSYLGNPKAITNVNTTGPITVTAVAHGKAPGDRIRIKGCTEVAGLDGTYLVKATPTADTLTLNDIYGVTAVNTSGFNGATTAGNLLTTVTSISGLSHLEGRAVAVTADGNEVTGLTVSAGAITLPRPAAVVHVGLAYTPAIETLDIDQPGQQTFKSKHVSVSRVIIEVEKSRGGWVGPKNDDGTTGEMIEIKPRFESDGYDAIALKDFKQEIDISPAWSRGGGIRIEQRSPFPLAILSVIPSVDVGD